MKRAGETRKREGGGEGSRESREGRFQREGGREEGT